MYGHLGFHRVILEMKQDLLEPRMPYPVAKGKKYTNSQQKDYFSVKKIYVFFSFKLLWKIKSHNVNSYLYIIIEDEMSFAIFCQQLKGVVVCKIFKLETGEIIQKTK